jgi:hypothetical protein
MQAALQLRVAVATADCVVVVSHVTWRRVTTSHCQQRKVPCCKALGSGRTVKPVRLSPQQALGQLTSVGAASSVPVYVLQYLVL